MKNFYFIISLFLSTFSFSQNNVGLYVNDFKNIIDNPTAENELLSYAQSHGFNYLLLYNLTYIHNNKFAIDNINTSLPLANFIANAKTNYGILKVAAIGEKNASFDKIKVYNSFYPSNPEKRFDVFNLEFEFWNNNLTGLGNSYCTQYLQPNGFTCDEAGAFDFYTQQLNMLFSYGMENNILTETYIGYIDQSQADILAQSTNRILIHYYRQSDVYNNGNSIFQYHPERLEFLATNNEVTVMPIFSARTNHMYNWLLTPHPLTQPYATWTNGTNGFNDQTASWANNVFVDGYVWYRYSDLKNVQQQLPVSEEIQDNKLIFYSVKNKSITFKNFEPENEVVVFSLNGRRVASFKVANSPILSNLEKGVYIVKVRTNDGVRNEKIAVW